MNDREVADYLLANPEFFAQHAELLATIRLANPHGKAAISLQERQMEMLRDKNKHLERRLAELVRYGHENDSLSAKFSRWTARVIAERDPYALPRTIADGIADVFDVPQTALRVWDVADTYAQAEFARQVQRDYTFKNPRFNHEYPRDGTDLDHQGQSYARYDYPGRY
ncbi:DUF484 family protein, partial [Burkholderia sp. Ac-20349]|uniref:DUF484 family protein n=1 Tax=Burkholderia sp. Ac-20349 TaxID=2703893 RepID=UPI001F11EC5E